MRSRNFPGEIQPTLRPGASVLEIELQSSTRPFLSNDFAVIGRRAPDRQRSPKTSSSIKGTLLSASIETSFSFFSGGNWLPSGLLKLVTSRHAPIFGNERIALATS